MIGLSGYSGLLGSSILRKLNSSNIKYKVFGRKKTDENLFNNFAYFDLNQNINKDLVSELKGIKTFINCAAQIMPTNSLSNLHLIHKQLIERNALYLCELVEACIKADVKKLIIISGTNFFKPNKKGFIDKDCGYQTYLNSPYLISKMVGEILCKTYNNKDLFIQIIRPSSLYGPYSKYSLVNKFIDNLQNGENIFIDGDGSWSSDFVYVDDVTEVIFKLINNFIIKEINVGTGKLTSILELADIISNKLNSSKKLIKFTEPKNIQKLYQNGFSPVQPEDCENLINRKMTLIVDGIEYMIKKINN